MRKLLSAGIFSLRKNLIYRIALLFSVGLAIFVMGMRWLDVQKHPDIYAKLSPEYSNADGLLFAGGLYLIFSIAAVISLFAGTEVSVIRNKLIVGHKRSDIFIAGWIVCIFAAVTSYLLYFIAALGFGGLLIGVTLPWSDILLSLLGSCAAVVSFTSILYSLAMTIQSRAIGSVVCLLITIVMMLAAITVVQKLSAPEYRDSYTIEDEITGDFIEMPRERNPYYLTGTKRQVYNVLNDGLPVGQLYQIALNDAEPVSVLAAYDLLLTAVCTGVGFMIFRKKDMK